MKVAAFTYQGGQLTNVRLCEADTPSHAFAENLSEARNFESMGAFEIVEVDEERLAYVINAVGPDGKYRPLEIIYSILTEPKEY